MILTVNSGSTSVKLAAFELAGGATLRHVRTVQHSGPDLSAVQCLNEFIRVLPAQKVAVVAHRVVHGGDRYVRPLILNDQAVSALDALQDLAPLHNPPAMRWIESAREVFGPGTMQIAVFDTAFFARLPSVAKHYAVPESMGAFLGVQRYGFHGIAHESMWRRWSELNPQLADGGRLISLQLGGGCSIAVIDRGRPLDVSMGFSPLEGLMMATRAGDIDPAVIPYLEKRLGVSSQEIVSRLNKESGLLGVSGSTSDVSVLLGQTSARARLAIDLYCYRARKYLGAFLAVSGGCDGIVFGGGVGEHVPAVRERILTAMEWARIELDSQMNAAARGGEAQLNKSTTSIQLRVLPPDEAASLARAALGVMKSD
jgi:acetate kinase